LEKIWAAEEKWLPTNLDGNTSACVFPFGGKYGHLIGEQIFLMDNLSSRKNLSAYFIFLFILGKFRTI
jgi:hypothetical protein